MYVCMYVRVSWLITLRRGREGGVEGEGSKLGTLIAEEVRNRGKIGLNQSLKIHTSLSPTSIQLFIFPSSTQ
jgi:hypothetical protein